MTFDKGLRIRVERLLAGAHHARDLDELFLALRQRSFGAKLVREIGDFSAHRQERDQGIACKSIQNFALLMGFSWRRDTARREGLPIPGDIDDFLSTSLAALEMDHDDNLRATLRMPRGQVVKLLRSAHRKIVDVRDGQPVFSEELSPKERAVCDRYFFAVPLQWAFDEDNLVGDLATCLVKNRLICDEELEILKTRGQEIAVFAMDRMHLSSVPLPGGTVATLHIGREWADGDENLSINAHIPVDIGRPNVFLMTLLFKTRCRVEHWLEPREFAEALQPASGIIEPVEINAAGKLQVLV
ncbi:hypothetical protein [Alteraurantiacibacter buctensis]|uniref:Uncharacterized protein n=1 Tax=Alteraurantiacibacter buctensis TaxID=1503981 RepID=A0A844Z038_9SPHN|nr:hypothetical protein [Alteraurantiacibacter buctensis]MXO73179.1 hypothetical protein [Alteraurantiacibacter buctensis]